MNETTLKWFFYVAVISSIYFLIDYFNRYVAMIFLITFIASGQVEISIIKKTKMQVFEFNDGEPKWPGQ